MPTYDIRPSVATLQVSNLESNSSVTFEKTSRRNVVFYLCTDLHGSEFDYSIGELYPEGKVVQEIAEKVSDGSHNAMKSYSNQMLIFSQDTRAYLNRKKSVGNRLRMRWERVPGVTFPCKGMDLSPRWVVNEPDRSRYMSLIEVHRKLGGTQQEHKKTLMRLDPDYLQWHDPDLKRDVIYFSSERIRPYVDRKLKRRPVDTYNREEWYDSAEACKAMSGISRSSLARFVENYNISTIRVRSKSARIMVLYNKQELDNKINEHSKTHSNNPGQERVS